MLATHQENVDPCVMIKMIQILLFHKNRMQQQI